jgi:hypothetical protein
MWEPQHLNPIGLHGLLTRIALHTFFNLFTNHLVIVHATTACSGECDSKWIKTFICFIKIRINLFHCLADAASTSTV